MKELIVIRQRKQVDINLEKAQNLRQLRLSFLFTALQKFHFLRFVWKAFGQAFLYFLLFVISNGETWVPFSPPAFCFISSNLYWDLEFWGCWGISHLHSPLLSAFSYSKRNNFLFLANTAAILSTLTCACAEGEPAGHESHRMNGNQRPR